ncbi:MAG: monovalent cation/H+ antiporter subunit D family protein [Gammaproteobacteria bacterium]|nr:monovalent cation/H+ antiporter subunit D family protein [Gammaproteobacteria bacterium]
MSEHLPVMLLVVPLLAAPLCVLLHHEKAAWLLSLAVITCVFSGAWTLLGVVLEQGVQRYAIGDWPVPWGIELYIDSLNAFVLVIVATIAAAAILFAGRSVASEIAKDRSYLFYCALLLNLTGLLGVIMTGDAFNLFVFIEISSLSSYALISLGQKRAALYAAFRYLILGTIGASFILIGVGLLYAVTGTLNMQDIGERISQVSNVRTVTTAISFLVIGLAIKLALFPLHVWLPAAYATAPSVVSVFLAGTSTKVFVYVLVRYLFDIFGVELVQGLFPVDEILLLLAMLAIVYGSWVAITRNSIKSLLAWSSVAQIGYMVLGISLLTMTGLTASILHLFNHAIIKSALFMAVGCLVYKLGTDRLDDLRTSRGCMPWTRSAFVLAGLSLIGVPGTVGFLSKWYLLQAAFEIHHWPALIVIIAGSLMAVVYLWKIVEVLYFRSAPAEGADQVEEVPVLMLLPLWLLIAANIWFGIDTSLTIGSVLTAAEKLAGL